MKHAMPDGSDASVAVEGHWLPESPGAAVQSVRPDRPESSVKSRMPDRPGASAVRRSRWMPDRPGSSVVEAVSVPLLATAESTSVMSVA